MFLLGVYVIEDVYGGFSMDNVNIPTDAGIKWRRHTDKSDEQLVFVYPKDTIAKTTKLGLKKKGNKDT